MSAQVAADLRAAADLLGEAGWCQGASQKYHSETDSWSYCTLGAIGKSTVRSTDGYEGYWAAVEAFQSLIAPAEIVRWNDTRGRTADEVITALRAAADAAEVSP